MLFLSLPDDGGLQMWRYGGGMQGRIVESDGFVLPAIVPHALLRSRMLFQPACNRTSPG
jgi:hypothetical protein